LLALFIPISNGPIRAAHEQRAATRAVQADKDGGFAAELSRRREELGNPALPRNSGKRRTASKIALLKAIEEAGGKW
jgi:hypothetical protein